MLRASPAPRTEAAPLFFLVALLMFGLPTRPTQAQTEKRNQEIEIPDGRTSTLRVTRDLGDAIERAPEFQDQVPSYRRAIARDAEQRWAEAATQYQQALAEIGGAISLDDNPRWKRGAFKIDLERRRALTLARDAPLAVHSQPPGPGPERTERTSRPPSPAPRSSLRLASLERGRLLRLKLMAVRAATGAAPMSLVNATLTALSLALHERVIPNTTGSLRSSISGSAPTAPTASIAADAASPEAGTDAEVRLLLCATRAAAGDLAGAHRELDQVTRALRSQPARAVALAVCQAALGRRDDAIASLAVGVYRLSPESRFLPEQSRELEAENDWDVLRQDPRFGLLFR